MPVRDILELIHRTAMTFVTLVLAGGSVLAWWHSTPANGLLLVAGMLALLALIAGLSIVRRGFSDAESETIRQMVDAAGAVEPENKAALIRQLMRGKPVTVNVHTAEPEVYRIDALTVEEAKRLADEGRPIDEVCRAVDPEFDSRDEMHKQAFRRLVQTMVEADGR